MKLSAVIRPKNSDTKIRIALIGAGPHARTFYIPYISHMSQECKIELSCIIDLKGQESLIRKYTIDQGIAAEMLFVDGFKGALPAKVVDLLDDVLKRLKLDGVIISTDPLSHKCYAEWALNRKLNILMDKPITTRENPVGSLAEARGIEDDYCELANSYSKLQKKHNTCFVICAHRRYHPGIIEACRIIHEVSTETGCPVTNLHSYHCDGQWRLPSEILTQEHHSYHHGHGKVSHSGYHFIDCLCSFWKAGCASGKKPTNVECFSSFIQPAGLVRQLSRKDHVRIFGRKYAETNPHSDNLLLKKYAGFGEVDAEITFTFLKDDIAFGNASLSLVHNGFSRRSWLQPGKDLYKGNGRVKHEQHLIHVGPFLSIQIHSYQAKDSHKASGAGDFAIGGNNHFELVVFRNTGIIGGIPVEVIGIKDLKAAAAFDVKRLFIEQVKAGAIKEFIDFIRGRIRRSELKSNIDSHYMPVKLMSAAYMSHIGRTRNPIVKVEWREDGYRR
jgi:predicted dehydrogenase